jgi:heptaprenyl diphosphate synthase
LVVNISRVLDLPRPQDDLDRLETHLRSAVASEDPFLTEVARHLIDAGGKRIRPVLALAAALAGQPEGVPVSDEVLLGGVSVELVHLGSLYHDDVIDGAATRRGVETVNSRWGNLLAIIAGDFLLAKASLIASGLGTEVSGLLATTIGSMCQGEVLQMQTTFDVTRSETSYLAAIAGKTAALMACSCRIGSIAAGHDRPQIEALTAFGHAFGMVFQICDDVLDVTATDETLGKPAGLDLVAGVYTLPVIRSLAVGDSAADELRAMLVGPLDRPERDKVREIVRSSGAVSASLATARDHANSAGAALTAAGLVGRQATALCELPHHLIDEIRL